MAKDTLLALIASSLRRRRALVALSVVGSAMALSIPLRLVLREDPSVHGLIKALHDENPEIRLRALNAAIQSLESIRGSGREGEFEPELIDQFLRRFGWNSSTFVKSVGACLRSRDPVVRMKSSYLLRIFGGRADPAFPSLVPALDDPEPKVRRNAIETVGQLGRPVAEIVPILMRKMKDPSEGIREVAAFELAEQFEIATPAIDKATGKLHQPDTRGASTIPSLIVALKDPIVQVRRGAAHCLFRLGNTATPARRDLEAALADPDDIVRLFAAKAIILLDPKNLRAFDILIAAFPQVVSDLRPRNYDAPAGAAREVILRIGPAAIPLLIKNFTDNQTSTDGTKVEIAHLLGWFGKEAVDAVPALTAALIRSSIANIRLQSAWALGEIGGSVKIDPSPLIFALRDPESMVRYTAVRALGSLHHLDKKALVALEESRHDGNREVRDAAESVLQGAR